MTKPALKIGPIPDRTPIKISILIDSALKADLDAYSSCYEEAYGDKPSVDILVPYMLEAFLASDAGFRKVRRRNA